MTSLRVNLPAASITLGPTGSSDLNLAVRRYLARWHESGNPHWVDLAVWDVTRQGQKLGTDLQLQAAQAAAARLAGTARGTRTRVIREEVKGRCFACMALLIAGGTSVDDAAAHAANAVAGVFGRQLYVASGLNRDYGALRGSLYGELERQLAKTELARPAAMANLMEHLRELRQFEPGSRR
jgi:hypothetical protein